MDEIEYLIERSRAYRQTPEQEEQQRRSFAYGNAKIENDRVTWEMIDSAAERIKR
ncbi:MAG TPA: hypothetical protein VGB62_07675 [Allosphingosinicella sp.]|jgi:hypothetical protein